MVKNSYSNSQFGARGDPKAIIWAPIYGPMESANVTQLCYVDFVVSITKESKLMIKYLKDFKHNSVQPRCIMLFKFIIMLCKIVNIP